jgi:F-type H+-transporting ATPase subunit a
LILPIFTALFPLLFGGGKQDPFEYLFGHVMPHKINGLTLFGLQVWNIQYFQLAAIGLMFVAFAGVARAVRNGNPGPVARVLAGWVAWIRDEMVYPNMQKEHAQKLLPLFITLFFFILFMNLFGLIPFGATATASVYVTAALACITFGIMLVGGILIQGPIAFWKNLIPHGVPWWLIPLIFVMEFAGLFIKPFALTIRLMANMMGGHLVLLSFMGLAFHFGSQNAILGLAIAPISIGLSMFMMILESFVALLQAYIFTLLSVIFVSMCLHPDH